MCPCRRTRLERQQTGCSTWPSPDVLAPALVRLFTQACSRARHTPRRAGPAYAGRQRDAPWSEVQQHHTASGASSAGHAGPCFEEGSAVQ